jgi:hypothetical protein
MLQQLVRAYVSLDPDPTELKALKLSLCLINHHAMKKYEE